MGRKRQLQKQEEIRNEILEVARSIIAKDGVRGLSIRKITNAMDYSPAIIYHYFKDKGEIIETLVNEGYGRILAAVRSVKRNEDEPDTELREVFTNYIKQALAIPEEYKAMILNDEGAVLQKTALLERGISRRSPTMQMLCDNIQRGIDKGCYPPCDPELTAQIIWTATFGLIIKLIIEKDISSEQVERLVDRHFEILFSGIKVRS